MGIDIDKYHLSGNFFYEDGIFYSKVKNEISYPDAGSDICFELEENSYWFKHRNDCIIEIVKKFNPGTILFDIGGGNGFVSYGLQQNGIMTVLVEPGETGARNAKIRKLKYIFCSTIEDLGLSSNSIDSIGLFDVLEHIEDDYNFVSRIYYYLKPGGTLFLTVPAYKLLWSNEDKFAGHYRRYTLKNLNALLKKSGFSILYSTYMFSILAIAIFVFRVIPSFLGFYNKSIDPLKHKNDHMIKNSIPNILINHTLKYERKKICSLRSLWFGSSCLLVCRKLPDN